MVEQEAVNFEVAGSNPAAGAKSILSDNKSSKHLRYWTSLNTIWSPVLRSDLFFVQRLSLAL